MFGGQNGCCMARMFVICVVSMIIVRSEAYRYDGDSESVMQVKRGDNVTLTCDCEHGAPQNRIISWLGNDGRALRAASVIGITGVEIVSAVNDTKLILLNLQQDAYGFYYCIAADGATAMVERMWKFGVNIDGPAYIPFIETYENNLVLAAIIAGSFLGISILVCVAYRMLRKSDDTEDVPHPQKSDFEQNTGSYRTNPERNGLKHESEVASSDNSEAIYSNQIVVLKYSR